MLFTSSKANGAAILHGNSSSVVVWLQPVFGIWSDFVNNFKYVKLSFQSLTGWAVDKATSNIAKINKHRKGLQFLSFLLEAIRDTGALCTSTSSCDFNHSDTQNSNTKCRIWRVIYF